MISQSKKTYYPILYKYFIFIQMIQNTYNRFASTALYVGSLLPQVNSSILFEIFNSVSPVSSIKIARDRETRESLGYAYINFASIKDGK